MKFSLFITYKECRKTLKMLKNKNHEQPICIFFVIAYIYNSVMVNCSKNKMSTSYFYSQPYKPSCFASD